MTQEEFKALARMQGLCVRLQFSDGQTIVATLLSVSTDFDGSQHLIYQTLEGSRATDGELLYTPGEEVVSCELGEGPESASKMAGRI